jgi:hypothetical protein
MKLIDILKEAIKIYPSSNFQLLSKKKEKKQFGSGYNTVYTYLLNDEDYTTPSGLTFNIKTIGYILSDNNKEPDFSSKYVSFFYIQTDVYVGGKKLTTGSGISGFSKYGSYDVAGSVNKAKKWLDKNGDNFITGEKQFVIPST